MEWKRFDKERPKPCTEIIVIRKQAIYTNGKLISERLLLPHISYYLVDDEYERIGDEMDNITIYPEYWCEVPDHNQLK